MNLNPTQRDLVVDWLTNHDYSSYDDAVNQMNTPSIPNPVPQADIPKPWSWADALQALSPSTLNAILSLPTAPVMIEQLNENKSETRALWFGILDKLGVLPTAEKNAISALVSATIPDPSYRPLLSWAEVNLGRDADQYDVLESVLLVIKR